MRPKKLSSLLVAYLLSIAPFAYSTDPIVVSSTENSGENSLRAALDTVSEDGTIVFDFENDQGFIVVDENPLVIKESITLDGVLEYVGLNSVNGYSGAILQFDSEALSPPALTITNQLGNPDFPLVSNVILLEGLIEGDGSITKKGEGLLVFIAENNTFTGGLDLQEGYVFLEGTGSAGVGPITLADGVVLGAAEYASLQNSVQVTGVPSIAVLGNSSMVFEGTISGEGALNTGILSENPKINAFYAGGRVVLAGENTFTGGISVSNGKLGLTNSQSAGPGPITMFHETALQTLDNLLDENAVANDVVLEGLVKINTKNNRAAFTGVISDGDNAGALLKSNDGTLGLLGNNTFTGGIKVEQGRLALGSKTAAGTGIIILDDRTRLSAWEDLIGDNAVLNPVVLPQEGKAIIRTAKGSMDLKGVISGPDGTLIKKGAKTLILSGENTFSGGVKVKEGTLGLGHHSALGESKIRMNYQTCLQAAAELIGENAIPNKIEIIPATIEDDDSGDEDDIDHSIPENTVVLDANNYDMAFSGKILGVEGTIVAKRGAKTVTLLGNNKQQVWSTSLEEGTLAIASPESLGDGDITFASNATLKIDPSFENDTPMKQAVTIGDDVTATIDTSGTTLRIKGDLTGDNGILKKVGEGILSLRGEGQFAGDIQIDEGTLFLTEISSVDGMAAYVEDDEMNESNPLEQGGSILFSGSSELRFPNEDTDFNKAIHIPSGVVASIGAPEAYTGLIGPITGDGTFRKVGDSLTDLRGVKDFQGTIEVNEGVLGVVNRVEALGSADVVFTGDSVVCFAYLKTDSDPVNNTFRVNPGVEGVLDIFYADKNTEFTGEITIANDAALVIHTEDYPISLSGNVSGEGILAKEGPGVLTLGGTHSYRALEIDQGIVSMPTEGSVDLGEIDVIFTGDATILFPEEGSVTSLSNPILIGKTITGTIDSGGNDLTLSGQIRGAGTLAKINTGDLTLSGIGSDFGELNVEAGDVYLKASLSEDTNVVLASGSQLFVDGDDVQIGALSGSGTLDVGDKKINASVKEGQTQTFSGNVIGTGNFSKKGAGTFILSGNASFGEIDVTEGSVQIDSDASISSKTAVKIASGANFDVNVNSTIGGVQGAGSINLGTNQLSIVIENETPGKETSIGGPNAPRDTFDGDLTGDADAILVKSGNGTLKLVDSPNFLGNINIEQGQLVIVGDIAGSAVVEEGGTLFLKGTLDGGVVVNGGTYSPGASIGDGVIGSLAFSPGSTMHIELGANGTIDTVTVTGVTPVDLSTATAVFSPLGAPLDEGTYTYITAAGGISDPWGAIDESYLPYEFELSYSSDPGGTATITIGKTKLNENNDAVYSYLGRLDTSSSVDLETFVESLWELKVDDLRETLDSLTPAFKGAYALILESNANTMNSYLNPLEEKTIQRGEQIVWTKVFRNQLNLNAHKRIPSFDSASYSLALGTEIGKGVNTLGAYIGYQRGSIDWKQDFGSGRFRSCYIGGYEKFQEGRFSQFASIQLGFDDLRGKRNVPYNDLVATERHSARDFAIRAGIAYKSPSEKIDMSPFLKASCFGMVENAYEENGADDFNLNVRKKRSFILRSQLGFTFSKVLKKENGVTITPTLNLAADALAPLGNTKYIASFEGGADTSFQARTYDRTWFFASPSFKLECVSKSGLTASLGYALQANKFYHNQAMDARFSWKY